MATIVVTAAAGDLGQAIVKALRIGTRDWNIVGADLDVSSPARAFLDDYRTLPHARDPSYPSRLDRLAKDVGAVAVVPASEHELRVLEGTLPTSGAVVVGQARATLDRHLDKLTSFEALRDKVDLAPFANGAAPGDVAALVDEFGFPVVVKPRRSSGSRHVHVAVDQETLAAALDVVPEPLVQAYLPGDDNEFSVGVFRGWGEERAIVFRRTLRPGIGLSWHAEVVDAPAVAAYAIAAAAGGGLEGSSNVQARAGADGPRLLEINPRFSSLAAARAAAGFNDVEWSVLLSLGERVEPLPNRFTPLRFQRFFAEVIDLGPGYAGVTAWSPRSSVVEPSGSRGDA